jgi:hypothetical protein
VGGWQRGSGETVHSSDTHLYSYCGACVPLRTSRSNDGFCSATHALAATLATAAYRATASCTREVTPRGTSKTPISLEAMKQKVDAMGGKRLAAGRVSVCRKGSGWIDTSDAPSSARQSALEWARTVGDLVWERACVQILFAVTDRVNNRIRIKRAFWKKCIQVSDSTSLLTAYRGGFRGGLVLPLIRLAPGSARCTLFHHLQVRKWCVHGSLVVSAWPLGAGPL